ncbi:MAG: hypothetical protein QGG53_17585 [Planctomycetota bacterium]|jgi:hypothetical protein|nr:hypothetical protein [Planctomycetota bacterium]
MKQVSLILIFVHFAFIRAGVMAESIPISIDDPAGLTTPWPLTCGVPFPQGKLKEASTLSLHDAAGRHVPCQIDVTGTWLDGSVRWVLLNFLGIPSDSYSLKIGGSTPSAKPAEGMTITEGAEGILVNTGPAEFLLRKDDALLSRGTFRDKPLLEGGEGAYLVDNRGRRAQLGGANSEMTTRFLARGPRWTVIRKEGWYVTQDGTRLARGIGWLHFFGNSPSVKVVHRLVLTEDTNDVWFKDIGIHFPVAFKGKQRATFDTSPAVNEQATTVDLQDGVAWMLQDDFPHFMSRTSNFEAVHQSGAEKKKITSGAACGDWCDLSTEALGLSVVLRDLAEQFPKELTVTPAGVTAHLWAGRSGRELDFRTPTLMKEYWGEWCDYANIELAELAKIRSNAQASAKTHVLWLLPHEGPMNSKELARRAHAAAERVLASPSPTWTCNSGALGPRAHPKDLKRFPREEAFVSDFFDRLVLPNRTEAFPLTGYIAWGANPCTRYGTNEKGKHYATWWRISGLVDYYLRRNVWTLYARSGERKYFEYGERFNRFAGDMNMHHWESAETKDEKEAWKLWLQGTLKVKGGFGHGLLAKGERINAVGEGAAQDSIPIYWRRRSFKPGGSGAGIVNNLYHFYFTGDWEIWELAENFAAAIKNKKWRFMHEEGLSRGAIVHARYLTHLYSMRWDKELGEMLRTLMHRALDRESPVGINPALPPSPLYKTGRSAIAMLDYYFMTGDELAKECFLKMVDYEFRFGGARPTNPIGYQDATAYKLAMAWRFTGQEKYLRLARQLLEMGLRAEPKRLSEELASTDGKLKSLPYRGQCFNYQACLNTPIVLRDLADYKGPLAPVPMLVKELDSTKRAWAVFRKKENEPVSLDMEIGVEQEDDVELVVLGPDLKPTKRIVILQKEKRFKNSFTGATTTFFLKARIPVELPGGVYRLGHANPGAFAVIDASVEKMVLECPDGFWVRGYMPFYFRVPEGLKTVELFTSWPVTITRSDGSLAKPTSDAQGGKLSLPVEGKSGYWKIEYERAAFVRLRNVPPVVSCLTPDRFFFPEKFVPLADKPPALPDPKATFVQGVFGGGLQLNAKDVLQFERGEKLPDGGYQNFPMTGGTIEFYFRPNWSATNTAGLYRTVDARWPLISAGQISIRYRYGLGSRDYAFLDFLCGQTRHKARGKIGTYGSHARFFPRAGEWLHIAATWDVLHTTQDYNHKQFTRDTRFFNVFINGKRYLRTWPFPTRLKSYIGKSFAQNYDLSDIPEWIRIGPGDGTFDELRISDVIRYRDDFVSPTTPFKLDDQTRLLMHFDESTATFGKNGSKVKVKHQNTAGAYIPEKREW